MGTCQSGKGTTFKVYFPFARGIPNKKITPNSKTFSEKGTNTILLVEDEKIVRDISKNILKHIGYKVLPAPNAETALRLIKKHKKHIDLLLTDIILPGMSGVNLAEEVYQHCKSSKHFRRIKVLFTSGYDNKELSEFSKKIGKKINFISKPYNPEQLAYKVMEALNDEKG